MRITILKVLASYLIYLPLFLILRIIGIPLVALGLLFVKDLDVSSPYTQYPEHGNWTFLILPSWLRCFNNIADGVRGDRRGWYHNEYKDKSEYFRQFWWTAIRNPTNYLSRFVTSVDVTKVVITKLYGIDKVDNNVSNFGYQLLQAVHKETGKHYYHFQACFKLTDTKCMMFRVGHKFSLGDDVKDYGPTNIDKTYDNLVYLAVQWRKSAYGSDSSLERFKGLTLRYFPTIKDYSND